MVKVNMMCGKRRWDGWAGVDGDQNYTHTKSRDVYLRNQFDNSIDLLYCSHGIAYFDQVEIIDIIKAWFSKIRPGGTIQIATSNWDVLKNMAGPVLGPIFGRIEYYDGNRFIQVYQKCIYNFATLKTLLESVGFTDIKLYDHRTTCHPNTGNRKDFYDDHSASYIGSTLISLNVQATKP